ncbi:catalase, partial [Helicobacter pylori]
MKKIGLSLCLVFSLGFLKAHEVSAEEIADIFYKLNAKEPK